MSSISITKSYTNSTEKVAQAAAAFSLLEALESYFTLDPTLPIIKSKYNIVSEKGIGSYGLGLGGSGGGGGFNLFDGLTNQTTGMALDSRQGYLLDQKILGKADSGHEHSWAVITNKPLSFAPSAHSHSWDSVTDKPTAFAPSAHNHAISGITDLSDALAGKEASLGNPTSDGQIIASTTGGVRSWVNRYVLPVAAAAVLGGVMVGTGLNANAQGLLAHSDFSVETGIGGTLGHIKSSERSGWNSHVADTSSHLSIDERAYFNKLKTYFLFASDNSSVHTPIVFYSDLGVGSYGLGSGGSGGGGSVNVIDNLISTSTTEALSANMGRYLSNLISSKSDTGHSHSWDTITSKPVTFTPTAHQHSWSEITSGKPTTLGGYGISSTDTMFDSKYIQNQNASAQTGYLWISGYGLFGERVDARNGGKSIYLYNNGSTIKLDAYEYGTNVAIPFQIGGNGGAISIVGTTTFLNSLYGTTVSLGSGTLRKDAILHITGTGGSGSGRLTQLNPIGTSQDGINLVASTDASGTDMWWAWGVRADSGNYELSSAPGFGGAGMSLARSGAVSFSSVVTALGGNSTQWNTAYGWGNHAGLYAALAGSTSQPFSASSLTLGVATGNGTNSNPYFDNLISRSTYPNYAIQFGNSAQSDYATYLRFKVNTRGTPDVLVSALTLAPDYAIFNSTVSATGFTASGYTVYHTGNLTNALSTGSLPYWTGSSLANSGIAWSDSQNVFNAPIKLTDSSYYLGSPTHGHRFNDNGSNYNNFIIYEDGHTYTRGSVGIKNTTPHASLHIGSGSGSLHYNGSDDGTVLIHSGSGGRSRLEILSPNQSMRMIIQAVEGYAHNIGLSGGHLFLDLATGYNMSIGFTEDKGYRVAINGSIYSASSIIAETSVKIGNWEFIKNGDSEILLKLSGALKAKVDSSGNILALAGVGCYAL